MKNKAPTIAVVIPHRLIGPVLTVEALSRLQQFAKTRLLAEDTDVAKPEQAAALLSNANACLMSWGSPRLEAKLLEKAPRLRMVAYAAGSVRGVVTPEVFDRGITITSAASANAAEVACVYPGNPDLV